MRALFSYPGYLSAGYGDGVGFPDTVQIPATSEIANTSSVWANCSFTVVNMSYVQLVQNSVSLQQFEDSLRLSLSTLAGNSVQIIDIAENLTAAGTEKIQVSTHIFSPQTDFIQWRLNTTAPSVAEKTILQNFAQVSDLEAMSLGQVRITNWYAPLYEEASGSSSGASGGANQDGGNTAVTDGGGGTLLTSSSGGAQSHTWLGAGFWIFLGLCALAAFLVPLYLHRHNRGKGKRHRGLGHDQLMKVDSDTLNSARTMVSATTGSGGSSDASSDSDEDVHHTVEAGEKKPLVKVAGGLPNNFSSGSPHFASNGLPHFASGLSNATTHWVPGSLISPVSFLGPVSPNFSSDEYDLVTITEGGISIHPLKYSPPPGVPLLGSP